MRSSISPFDHAFADGRVFERPESRSAAKKLFKDLPQNAAEAAADTLLSVWAQFSAGAILGEGVKLGLNARLISLVDQKSVKILGPCAIRGILRIEAGGTMNIDPFVYIGDQSILSARRNISIGASTLIAHGVQIFDNNSHPINAYEREVQFRRMLGDKSVTAGLDIKGAPVIIGRRAWIGMSAIVMKGVEIGADSVIASGAVVTRSVPAGVIAAGNPAEVLRPLTDAERSGG